MTTSLFPHDARIGTRPAALTLLKPSFDDLVRAHAGALYRFAYWLARDRQLAEDIVQEALLRGWKALPRLREARAAKSWLFSIVRNEHRRLIVKNGPQHDSIDADTLEIADERPGPFRLEMRDAIMALPVTYAEPLALQVLGGFSCAEIAVMLETSEGAVMTRLTRARQALKRLITPAGAKEQEGGRK